MLAQSSQPCTRHTVGSQDLLNKVQAQKARDYGNP